MDRKNAVLEYCVAETNGPTAPEWRFRFKGADGQTLMESVTVFNSPAKAQDGFVAMIADRHEPVRGRVSRVAEFRGMTCVRMEPFGFQAREEPVIWERGRHTVLPEKGFGRGRLDTET